MSETPASRRRIQSRKGIDDFERCPYCNLEIYKYDDLDMWQCLKCQTAYSDADLVDAYRKKDQP